MPDQGTKISPFWVVYPERHLILGMEPFARDCVKTVKRLLLEWNGQRDINAF